MSVKIIVSVSKAYSHRGSHRHRTSTKKKWYVYYYDEDGSFHTEQVNFIQALYYMTQRRERIKILCERCNRYTTYLVKRWQRSIIALCPYCDGESDSESFS